MRARSPICLLIICLLTISLLAFHVPQAWAWDWSLERPSSYVQIDEQIHGASTDEKASVGLGIHITEYMEDSSSLPFDGKDGLIVRTVATSNVRKIIDYNVGYDDYYWHDNLPNQLNWGDNSVDWIEASAEFGYKFRFYGGVGSAEYGLIWVSSNGVIFFNDTCTDPYYSAPIPDKTDPDNFIAPFWRDLKPNLGSSITYGTVQHPSYNPVYCLAISWNNVPDVNGNPQTFQVILEPAPTGLPRNSVNYWQSRIWFQYKSITLDEPTTVGIEDQLGERGNHYNYLDLSNETTLEIARYGNYAVITSLGIEMIENDYHASIEIAEDLDWIRGVNVDLQPAPGDGDPGAKFLLALAGGATLLLGVTGIPELVLCGLIADTVLWGVDTAEALASTAKKAEVDFNDNQPDGVSNYAIAPAYEPNYQSFPVDAWFGVQFYWIFTDQNNQPHTLTVRTKLKYDEYTKYGSLIGNGEITTSKTLHVEPAQHTLSISTTAGGTTYPEPGTHNYIYGTPVTVTAYPDTRYLFDYWLLDGATAYDNPITVTMDSDHDLSAHFTFVNNPPDTPSTPYGTGGGVGTSYTFYTSTTDPDGDNVCFTFDWDDGSNTTTDYYPSEYPWANASHTWSSAGTYNISVRAQDIHGTWSESWSETTEVTITGGGGGGGGGGCPTLFSWNRTAYAEEALLDIHSNSDVTVDYTLSHLNPLNRYCLLSLRELDNYTSHIDYVKLYAVDNQGIWHECNLFLAWHSELGRVNHLLALDDDERVDLAPGERATLLFLLPKNIGDIQFFIFELNGHNPKGRPPRPL